MGTKDPLCRTELAATVGDDATALARRQHRVLSRAAAGRVPSAPSGRGDRLAGGGPPSFDVEPSDDGQAQPNGIHHGLGAIARPELAKNATEVIANGLLAQA